MKMLRYFGTYKVFSSLREVLWRISGYLGFSRGVRKRGKKVKSSPAAGEKLEERKKKGTRGSEKGEKRKREATKKSRGRILQAAQNWRKTEGPWLSLCHVRLLFQGGITRRRPRRPRRLVRSFVEVGVGAEIRNQMVLRAERRYLPFPVFTYAKDSCQPRFSSVVRDDEAIAFTSSSRKTRCCRYWPSGFFPTWPQVLENSPSDKCQRDCSLPDFRFAIRTRVPFSRHFINLTVAMVKTFIKMKC